MKIKYKIFGIAVILTFCFGLGGGLVIYKLTSATTQIQYFSDVCWPAADLIMETNIELQGISRTIIKPPADLDKQSFISDAKQTINDFSQEWASSIHKPELIANVQQLMQAMLADLDQAIEGDRADAFYANACQLFDLLESVEESFEAGVDMEADKTSSIILEAEHLAILAILIPIAIGLVTAYFLTRQIVRPINYTIAMLKNIAQGDGDLTQRVDEKSNDELGELGHWFNTFVSHIQQIIQQVAKTTSLVSHSANEIANTSDSVASGMNAQAMKSTEISSAVEEMSASIQQVAQQTSQVSTDATEAGNYAREGGEVVRQTIEGMKSISQVVSDSATAINELGKRSEQIGQIINVINDIADQTNLLALNAAIEAARAGEHGRGFAVVADEVRKLAERTTTATEEVAQSIAAIQNETGMAVQRISDGTQVVDEGVQLATQADQALASIMDSSSKVAAMIQNIAAAADEQSSASELISQNINNINTVTSESAQSVSQTARSTSELCDISRQLETLVGRFKID
ncbi:MAG: methyl-accepting chemotaxis protein [Phycisphaeraceae bacterium JB051]